MDADGFDEFIVDVKRKDRGKFEAI